MMVLRYNVIVTGLLTVITFIPYHKYIMIMLLNIHVDNKTVYCFMIVCVL